MFISELQNITINIDKISSNSIYILPEITDINGDNYSIDFINLPDFIIYNSDDFSLVYEPKIPLTIDEYGNYTVSIQLTDDKFYQSTYEINIEVFNNQTIEDEDVFIGVQIEDDDFESDLEEVN